MTGSTDWTSVAATIDPSGLAPDGPDSMGREICEGPAAVEATLAGLAGGAIGRVVREAMRVVLIGTGASFAMCEAAAPFFARPRAIVREASSIVFDDLDGQPIKRGDVAVAVSMSGASPETRAASVLARRAGATVVAVTARADSPLAGSADHVVLTPIGEETGAATKSELTAFAALAALAGALPTEPGAVAQLRAQLAATAGDLAPMVVDAEAVVRARTCWTLGFGPAFGLARAAALLLQEKARRPAVPCTPSEFRHGPIEAAGPEDVVFLVDAGAPQSRARDLYLDRLTAELATLGIPLVVVGRTGGLPAPAGSSPAVTVLHALLRVQQLARVAAIAGGSYREDFLVLRTVVGAADDLFESIRDNAVPES